MLHPASRAVCLIHSTSITEAVLPAIFLHYSAFAVEHAETRLRFHYRVAEGVCSKRQYMTDFLAEVAGIPATVHLNTCKRAAATTLGA